MNLDAMSPLDQVRNYEKPDGWTRQEWQETIDALLAAERLATVERITTLLCTCDDSSEHRPTWKWCRLYGVVLDEEGQR